MAVAFPILVLVYCYHHFQLDRAVFLLNMEFYLPGDFERDARMVTDPIQIALFRLVFDSLRIQTPLDFFLRVSLNLSICYQFNSVIKLFAQEREWKRRAQQVARSNRASFIAVLKQHGASVLLLVAFSVALLATTFGAITASQTACDAYPQCVAYAHRLSSSSCPCIAFIDVDRVPKTYEAWMNPANATDSLRDMALSGDLRIITIINRQLITWPNELQRCTNLQQM